MMRYTQHNTMVELSIIIISFNTSAITKRCLDTVQTSLAHDPQLKTEIIVLDNNSTDDSVDMLRSYAKKLNASGTAVTMKVISSKNNLGFGVGNNEAVKESTGTHVLFLNSDTEALDDAVPQLLKAYKAGSFDFAGAKLLNKDGSLQPSAGRFYTLPVACAALFFFADRYHFTRSSPSYDTQTDWVSGACFITTRKKYDAIGGFDKAIFMYWEEVDLFYRAHLKHLTCGFFHKPTFIHLEGASSKSRTAPIVKVFEGYIHFYEKHYSPLQVRLLKYMLQLKAIVSLTIGKVVHNSYLIETYTQAYEIVKKA